MKENEITTELREIRELKYLVNNISKLIVKLEKKEICKRDNEVKIKKLRDEAGYKKGAHIIRSEICKLHGIDIETFMSKSRKGEIVKARQHAMYFIKKKTRLILKDIASMCSVKDHATVLYSIRVVKNLSETDKKYKIELEEFERQITNRLDEGEEPYSDKEIAEFQGCFN